MTFKDAAKRALATLIAGAAAAPVAATLLPVSLLVALATAGLIAVVNLAGRLAQAWLDDQPKNPWSKTAQQAVTVVEDAADDLITSELAQTKIAQIIAQVRARKAANI